MHVELGRLQSFTDGALPREERALVEHHLSQCGACRDELRELTDADATLTAALGLLDRPAPAGRAHADAFARRRAPRFQPARRALPRAAVFLVGFAAAAAAASVPGSPVRDWLGSLGRPGSVQAPASPAPAATVAARPAVDEVASEVGVSVTPENGDVRVVLRQAAADVEVRAVLVSGDRAGVYARGAAASARFRTSPGRIEVDGVGQGELRMELPRSARSATVEVNGREYLRKDGDQLRLSTSAADQSGAEVSFRIRP